MLNIHFRELNTPRLRLRRLTTEDLPLYYERLASSEEVTRYMLWKPHRSIEESSASIQKALHRYETGESCRWVITKKPDASLIGIIDLMPLNKNDDVCTFAYMLAKAFWGNGYGTEAVKAVIDHAFSECGVQRIQADYFADNPASGAVMHKAGMQFLYTVPHKYEKYEKQHDACVCSITLDHWLKFRKETSSSDNS